MWWAICGTLFPLSWIFGRLVPQAARSAPRD